MSDEDIVIRLIQPNDYGKVLRFIRDYYCSDEPLCSSGSKIVPSESSRNYMQECLEVGTSILAVNVKKNGEEELVGINVGMPKDSSYIEEYLSRSEKEGNTKYGQMLKFMGIASRKADVLNRYGVDKFFYSFMICVKAQYRGTGCGARLKTELLALAKKLGYELVVGDCSSFYSARVNERMGWDMVSFFPYADYKDENGKQIFNPPAPHEGLTTLALRL